MTDLTNAKKILKLCINNQLIIDKILIENITPKHFIDAEGSRESKILSRIFKLVMTYHDESGGSLLTNDIFNEQIKDISDTKLQSDIVAEWLDVQSKEVSPDDLHYLVTEIKQVYASRLLEESLTNLQNNLVGKGLKEAVSEMQANLDKVHGALYSYDVDRTIFDIKERAEKFSEEYLYRINNREKFSGVSCGLPDIDLKTNGWQPGQLIVFLGSTGGGKSIQLMNCAIYANQISKKNVAYFSFEMSAWECELRTVSNLLEIPYSKIKSMNMSDIELKAMFDSYADLNEGAYFEYDVNIDDPSPEYIEARFRELSMTKGKPDIIIADYVGNMNSRNSRKDAKPWEKNGDAVEGLFRVAKKYQVPVLTAQQINREAFKENRKKKEEDKVASFYQDAASGDQRLMHLAQYVIALEADFKNKIMVYHSVKMRDAVFEPFVSTLDPEIFKVFAMAESAQEHWKTIKGLNNDSASDANIQVKPTTRRVYGAEDAESDDLNADDIPWG